MTPDRLRAWLDRQRVGARTVKLVHMRLDGESTIQTWTIDGETWEPAALATWILETAQDWANSLGESVRCKIVAVSDADVELATQIHQVRCTEAPELPAADVAHAMSPQVVIGSLLHALERANHCIWNSHASSTKALQDCNAMLLRQTKDQNTEIARLNALLSQVQSEIASDVVEAEEQRAESAARMEAWKQFGDVAPQALQLAMQYAQAHLPGPKPNGSANGKQVYEPPPPPSASGEP